MGCLIRVGGSLLVIVTPRLAPSFLLLSCHMTCFVSPLLSLKVCGKPVTTNTGKALRPPDNSRLILYLKVSERGLPLPLY